MTRPHSPGNGRPRKLQLQRLNLRIRDPGDPPRHAVRAQAEAAGSRGAAVRLTSLMARKTSRQLPGPAPLEEEEDRTFR